MCGEVPEWSNGAVSKTVVRAIVPRVRIPVSPPATRFYCKTQPALRCNSVGETSTIWGFCASISGFSKIDLVGLENR